MSDWRRAYDAYLFDLDGTLVDTAPDIDAALNHAMSTLGLGPVAISLTRHWVGHGSRMLITQALQHHAVEDDGHLEQALPVFLEYYSAHIAEHSRIYPGVEHTLAQLKARGAKLAVVTNKLAQLAEPLLQQIGLTPAFDLIVGGDTASAPKPDPAPVNLCLEQFNVAPDQTLFVGDSNTDVEAANNAGVPVVCVRDGYNHGTDVSTLNLNGVIDSFTELLI